MEVGFARRSGSVAEAMGAVGWENGCEPEAPVKVAENIGECEARGEEAP